MMLVGILVLAGLYHWNVVVTYDNKISVLDDTITQLNEEKILLATELGMEKANIVTLRGSIDYQNSVIAAQKVMVQEATDKWINRIPEKEYITKWKTKYVNSSPGEVDYEKCKTNALILNSISANGF